jgi:hypothetical protein
MCLLRFENNLLTIEGVRFIWISKKAPLTKLWFIFVSILLPFLVPFIFMPCCHLPQHMAESFKEDFLRMILLDLSKLKVAVKGMLVDRQLVDSKPLRKSLCILLRKWRTTAQWSAAASQSCPTTLTERSIKVKGR